MVLEGQSDLPALSSLIAKQVEAGDYMKEIWKDIPGFEGCYQASTLGRIRSLDRTITRGASKRRGPYEAKLKGRIIKPVLRKDGYVVVPLGESLPCNRVHQLIAGTFIPNPENKPMINHKNGDREDNSVNNLEWCTNQENQIHARDILKREFGVGKPVKCIETGQVFSSAVKAANGDISKAGRIRLVCNHKYGRKTCMGYHWEFV